MTLSTPSLTYYSCSSAYDSCLDPSTITIISTGATTITNYCNSTNLCNTGTATDTLTLQCYTGTDTSMKTTCPSTCQVSNVFIFK